MFRAHRVFDLVIFYGLLATIVITAIPYGSVQPWWIAFFDCVIFILAALAVVDVMITQERLPAGAAVALPLVLLCLFLVFQSLPLFAAGNPVIPNLRLAISADPFATQQLAMKLVALILAGLLLLRYVNTESRVLAVVYVVLGVGIASALFGLLRQGTGGPSWLLPLPSNNRGFAQFVNRNHFAFLMEMTLGLALGLVVRGARDYKRWLLFLPIAVFVWVSLIIANSRGAIFASLCQVIFLAILLNPFGRGSRISETREDGARLPNAQFLVQGLLIIFLIAAFAYGVRWVGGEAVVQNLELTTSSFTEQGGHERRENVSRRDIWGATWRLIKAHPLVGSGFGGYWIAITKHHDASGTFTPQEAHNDYLELLAGGGVVGAALFTWFLVRLVKQARLALTSPTQSMRAAALGAVVGIFGALAHNLVDFGLHITVNAFIFTVLIAVVLSCINLRRASLVIPETVA